MRRKKNLKKLLNLGLLDYTNLTPKCGDLDMPYIRCEKIPDIDYLATYSQPSTYFHTQKTCVTFFEYDVYFDGLYGLWNAIYYGVKELQEFYLERFCGVRYFIAPDYSKCGDVSEAENYYRQFRSRIVAIWLSMNLKAVVIPLVSCANDIGMKYMLDGMFDCTIVAFNVKGPMGDPVQLDILIRSIKYTVDHLPKHDQGGWGSKNPIKTQEEGQRLLDSGYHDGKQVYNITDDGIVVKFQPDNTPNNGYHSYEVSKPRDIPAGILKQMLADGRISRTEYNKFRKGKK